jgi:hypothetical protein
LKHRNLEPPEHTERIVIGGGTVMSANEDGRLVFAEYASGIKVRRNENSVFVRSGDGTYWFGDCKGRWFRLD